METKIDIYTQCIIKLYENGFDNTSINDILYELNISENALKNNFSCKDELLYLIYKDTYDAIFCSLNNIYSLEVSSLNKLNLFIKFLYKFVKKENMSLYIMLETSSKLGNILTSSNFNLLDNNYNKIREIIIFLIKDCQDKNLIQNINANIIFNMLISIINSMLKAPYTNNLTSLSLDEVESFFWSSILVNNLN